MNIAEFKRRSEDATSAAERYRMSPSAKAWDDWIGAREAWRKATDDDGKFALKLIACIEAAIAMRTGPSDDDFLHGRKVLSFEERIAAFDARRAALDEPEDKC